MGVFGCHETYVTLLRSMHFCTTHSIDQINVCTNFEMNRYKIDEFRKHAKMLYFIWCHVTQKYFDDLDIDRWPMLYWLSHKVGMKYWILLAKCHRNKSRINYMAPVSLEKRPILYNGIFRCHGNLCNVTFIEVCFCNVHIIGPINVCTNFEINRYNIDEIRKYTKIVCFVWRHVTQNGTSYVIAAGTLLIDMSIRNILMVFFMFWWSWPLTYILLCIIQSTRGVLESYCEVS